MIPDVRLVAVLRDPVARAISHHAHNLRSGLELEADFERAVSVDRQKGPHANYERQGYYARLLEPYLERFDRSQILLLDRSELAANPEAEQGGGIVVHRERWEAVGQAGTISSMVG